MCFSFEIAPIYLKIRRPIPNTLAERTDLHHYQPHVSTSPEIILPGLTTSAHRVPKRPPLRPHGRSPRSNLEVLLTQAVSPYPCALAGGSARRPPLSPHSPWLAENSSQHIPGTTDSNRPLLPGNVTAGLLINKPSCLMKTLIPITLTSKSHTSTKGNLEHSQFSAVR